MQDKKMLGRREFTVASAMAVLSGVAITISSCGGDSDTMTSPTASATPTPTPTPAPTPEPTPTPEPAPTPTPPPLQDAVGAVSLSNGHSHSAVITGAQLTAGGALSLGITGSGHVHTVELTADDMTAIAAGQTVAKGSSSTQAHTHTVTFN